MAKFPEEETSGDARSRMILNGKPVNPRTFEKLLAMTKTKPHRVLESTGTRLFLKRHIDAIVNAMPKTLKRGQKLQLKGYKRP